MSDYQAGFADPAFVTRYLTQGPPAFAPGHDGMLQMAWALLAERVPENGHVLVVGAGGGLETRVFAERSPGWCFTGVDPAPEMLDLALATAGAAAGDRLTLLRGSAAEAPLGPYDGATLILVLGIIPDDGSKLALLRDIRQRLKPGAPFVLVDQCMDRHGADFPMRVDRYLAYARASGGGEETLDMAGQMLRTNTSIATANRNEALLSEAGFHDTERFYMAMAWSGWVAYAG